MNRYVKFPEMWVRTLSARPTTAADWKIAVNLLARARFCRTVKFTDTVAAKLGVSKRTKWRSLNRLAGWGLISLRQRNGASPMVRVLWLAGPQPSDG
jgi:hypothetical protein